MRPPWGWIALIGAAWLALRLPVAFGMPLFMDEALYGAQAWTGLHDAGALFIGSPVARPPLQPWLAMGPLVAGLSPEAAVRIVSLASGLVTLGAVTALAARLGGRTSALFAAALCALLPFFVVNDVVGVADPVVTAAATCALLASVRLADDPRLRAGLLLGAALAAGVFAKLTGLLAVALAPAGLLLFDWPGADRSARLRRWTIGFAIALGMVAAVMVVMKLGADGSSLFKSESGLQEFRTPGDVLGDPVGSWRANDELLGTLASYVTWPVLLLAALGVAGARGPQRRLALLLALWAIVALAAGILGGRAPYPRYLMPAVPSIAVLAGHGAAMLARAVRARADARYAVALAGALLVALAIPAVRLDADVVTGPGDAGYPGQDRFQYVTGFPSGLGYDGLADALRQRSAGEGETVVAYDNLAPLQLGMELGNPQIEHRAHGISWREPFAVASGARRWTFVRANDPRADRAQFLLRLVGARIINRLPLGRYRLVAAYTRPEGLSTVQLLELR